VTRATFQRLAAARADVVVNHAVQLLGRQGPIGAQGSLRLNLRGIGHVDHRKLGIVVRRSSPTGRGLQSGGHSYADFVPVRDDEVVDMLAERSYRSFRSGESRCFCVYMADRVSPGWKCSHGQSGTRHRPPAT